MGAPCTSLSWVQLKLNEAGYHLKVAKLVIQNEAAAHYHLNAFATALCAVDDVMSNEVHDQPKTKAWWAGKRLGLRDCPDYQTVREFRNRTAHRGLKPPGLAYVLTFREHLDGSRSLQRHVDLVTADGRSIEDPLAVAGRALATVEQLIAQARELGHLQKHEKPGHTVDLRFEKEVEPSTWRTATPEDMAMVGNRMPEVAMGRPPFHVEFANDPVACGKGYKSVDP